MYIAYFDVFPRFVAYLRRNYLLFVQSFRVILIDYGIESYRFVNLTLQKLPSFKNIIFTSRTDKAQVEHIAYS